MIKKPPRRCRCPRKFCQNVGGEFWIHAQGFGTKIFFLNRDESLVRLAKAFAAKKRVSCVWIRIMDAGKAICRSKDTHMYW
jgi:hypothetical protein